jgi:hypothetical protein
MFNPLYFLAPLSSEETATPMTVTIPLQPKTQR